MICRYFLVISMCLLSEMASSMGGSVKLVSAPARVQENTFFTEELPRQLAPAISQAFRASQDIIVEFAECPEAPGAVYLPKHHRILICSGFLRAWYKRIDQQLWWRQRAVEFKNGATLFVLFHEIGHALVAKEGIPSLGREEDVVDSFAAYLLLKSNSFSTIGGAIALADLFERHSHASIPWDEHSSGSQRKYGFMCYAFGKAIANGLMNEYKTEIEKYFGKIPEERARRCQAEYLQLLQSAESLFGKHIR